MTLKQKLFVGKYIEKNGNGTQATLESYDTDNPSVAAVISSENLRKANIQRAIEEVLRSKGLTVDTIKDNLGYFANSRPEKIPADAAIKANIELAKLLDAYPGEKHTQVSVSIRATLTSMKIEEVQRELAHIDGELKEVMEGEVVDPIYTQND